MQARTCICDNWSITCGLLCVQAYPPNYLLPDELRMYVVRTTGAIANYLSYACAQHVEFDAITVQFEKGMVEELHHSDTFS